jgi:hypothetical protein
MNNKVRAITRGALLSALTALCCQGVYAQCDSQQQIVNVVKSRLPGERACGVLTSSPQQIFGAVDAIEADVLGGKSTVAPYDHEYWRYQEWLSSYAQRFGALSGSAENPEQKVLVVHDKMPDAFATGHTVVLTTGLIDWFTQPQLALENLGLTPEQATNYLAELEKSNPHSNPGPEGLIAVTALETAHNLLGHADAFPLAQACDNYMKDQTRQLYEYEKTVAMGKKPSWFSRIFSSGPSYPSLQMSEHQQLADADALGNWLTWKAERRAEAASLAAALRWTSLIPESSSITRLLPKGSKEKVRMDYISSMLCSDRSSLESRANSVGGSYRWNSAFDPPAPQAAPPVDEAISRFREFQAWYPSHRADIDRVARGELTEAEKNKMINVELEAKPDKATLLVDGKELPDRKLKTTLSIGPHTIASSYKGRTGEQRIVIFEDGPTKFNVEAK